MRHGSSGRRQRNRGGNQRRSSNNRNQVFDSNGPDVRIRGTAHQVAEKYEALAKDATSAGDIMMAQNYMQHAEHYLRIIGSWTEDAPQKPKSEQQDASGNEDVKEDDLSLPVSVLGGDIEVAAKDKSELESA